MYKILSPSLRPFDAVIFDLDGVITKTALVHAHAWKAAFDEYLRMREKEHGEGFREFTHSTDYLPYVDGKPRYEGVRSFLASRGISIPYGEPSDSPDKETVCGLGNKKNIRFNEFLKKDGAEVYRSSVKLVKRLKKSGFKVGVASSSKNCRAILESAGLHKLFETRVDGEVSSALGLKGKPEPDIFVVAARNLGAAPGRSVVVEDAISGVQAGRRGGFGLVLGIAREGNREDLLANGADIAIADLGAIDIGWIKRWFRKRPRRLLLQKSAILKVFSGEKSYVFFFDYDGTLTPIVKRPEDALLSQDTKALIQRLVRRYPVSVISGRMRDDVEKLVGIKGIFYAGSHGLDISGPGISSIHPEAKKAVPIIDKIFARLKRDFAKTKGVLVEYKKFSVAVHYRLTKPGNIPKIKKIVDGIVSADKRLRLMPGKKVFEILPDIYWNKGVAVEWIMQVLKKDWSKDRVVYIGDDVTDDDAFRVVRSRGVSILVSDRTVVSPADYYIASPLEVKKLIERIADIKV